MTISYTLRGSQGAALHLSVPDTERIPDKVTREVVGKLVDRGRQEKEAANAVRIADAAFQRAKAAIEAEAADAAIDGGAVPVKKLIKHKRATEDALAEARIELGGRQAAVAKAHGKAVETMIERSGVWRASAMESADAAILKLTTAIAKVREVHAELDEALSVIGMLKRLPAERMPVLTPIDKSGAYVSSALDHLTAAVGEAMESLDRERGVADERVDVVVPMAGAFESTPSVAIEVGDDDE